MEVVSDPQITIATAVDDELYAAALRLLPQLSGTPQPLTRDHLAEIVATTDQFVARVDGAIIGIATLVMYRTPVGVHAWIEDVVVDNAARGKGVGEALTRAMIERAKQKGVRKLALTSNPRREAANRLYQRLGFTPWQTNLYQLKAE